MTREELQRLYSECVSRAFRAEQLAGLVRGVESFLAEPDPTVEIAELLAEVDEAQAEAHNAQADYDRRGERMWRLAALAGWTPDEADNDATAELYIKNRLAEVDNARRELGDGHVSLYSEIAMLTARAKAAEATVRRVRGLAGELRAKHYLAPTATADAILRALDGGAS